jgi:hypothetical protein
MRYKAMMGMATVALLLAMPAAQAQSGRDFVSGFYGGLGGLYGARKGHAGMVAGGATGAAVGGWVYDTWSESRRELSRGRRVQPYDTIPGTMMQRVSPRQGSPYFRRGW